jgi:hypothetical protein
MAPRLPFFWKQTRITVIIQPYQGFIQADKRSLPTEIAEIAGRDVWLGSYQDSLPLDRHSACLDAPRISEWLRVIHFSLVTAGKSD